mgnify:CR=1 FL=1
MLRGLGIYGIVLVIKGAKRAFLRIKMTMKGETIVRFEDVSFEYGHTSPILDEVSFTVRRGAKVALMGQNGAGKSTLFHLIIKDASPEDGKIHLAQNLSVAMARQVIPREQLGITMREFFEKSFSEITFRQGTWPEHLQWGSAT